jgi:hypothetical protein
MNKHIFYQGYSLSKLVVIFQLVMCITFLSCCKKDSNTIVPIISKINMISMAESNLKGYELVSEHPFDSVFYDYYFENDTSAVFIRLGLYNSRIEAENAAKLEMEYISAVFTEGPYNSLYIGDKFWWDTDGTIENNVSNIIFIRYNALFFFSRVNFDLISLAKKIDSDIVKRASYIEFKE